MRISIEGLNEKDYENVCQKKINFDNLVQNISDLYSKTKNMEIYIKIANISVPTEEKKKLFFDTFSNICHKIFIENIAPIWSDYENNTNIKLHNNCDKGVRGQNVDTDIKICPFPFYQLVIHPDGDCNVCCADFKRELKIGNVAKEDLVSIWDSKKLRDFWKLNAEGKRNCFNVCKKCEYPNFSQNENIDDYSKQILQNLKHL